MDLATSQEGIQSTLVTTAAAGASSAEGLRHTVTTAAGAKEADIVAEADGAFVKGMPLDIAGKRMGEWLQRAAVTAAEPAMAPPALPTAAGGDTKAPEETTDGNGSGPRTKGGGGGGGARKAKKATLKQVLMQKGSGVSVYGPSVLEHCVMKAGLRPNGKLSAGKSVVAGGASGGSGGVGSPERSAAESQRGGFSEDEVCMFNERKGGVLLNVFVPKSLSHRSRDRPKEPLVLLGEGSAKIFECS